jgi:hypothetical protein
MVEKKEDIRQHKTLPTTLQMQNEIPKRNTAKQLFKINTGIKFWKDIDTM